LDKAELRQYRDLMLEAKELAEEIEQLRYRAQSRQWPDGQPRGNYAGDKMSGIVAKVADLSNLLEAKKESLLYRRRLIEEAIDKLEPIERRLIRLRYVQGLSWEKVCVDINYSWQHTHRLHAAALAKLKKDETS